LYKRTKSETIFFRSFFIFLKSAVFLRREEIAELRGLVPANVLMVNIHLPQPEVKKLVTTPTHQPMD
jgi:hypothetical protein